MYRLIDELGYELDRGSKKRMQKACAQNYGSQIVTNSMIPVEAVGWQEKVDKTFLLLVNRPDKTTITFNPEIHTIKFY